MAFALQAIFPHNNQYRLQGSSVQVGRPWQLMNHTWSWVDTDQVWPINCLGGREKPAVGPSRFELRTLELKER